MKTNILLTIATCMFFNSSNAKDIYDTAYVNEITTEQQQAILHYSSDKVCLGAYNITNKEYIGEWDEEQRVIIDKEELPLPPDSLKNFQTDHYICINDNLEWIGTYDGAKNLLQKENVFDTTINIQEPWLTDKTKKYILTGGLVMLSVIFVELLILLFQDVNLDGMYYTMSNAVNNNNAMLQRSSNAMKQATNASQDLLNSTLNFNASITDLNNLIKENELTLSYANDFITKNIQHIKEYTVEDLKSLAVNLYVDYLKLTEGNDWSEKNILSFKGLVDNITLPLNQNKDNINLFYGTSKETVLQAMRWVCQLYDDVGEYRFTDCQNILLALEGNVNPYCGL